MDEPRHQQYTFTPLTEEERSLINQVENEEYYINFKAFKKDFEENKKNAAIRELTNLDLI